MAVFVDPLFDTRGWSTNWPYPSACHLMADSEAELHAFAARLGLRRAWFQDVPLASHPHYDLTSRRRARAVKLGAIEVCNRFVARRVRLRGGLMVASLIPRIQDLRDREGRVPRCGLLVCCGCGAIVARCACGREDDVAFWDSCPACCTFEITIDTPASV